MKKTIKREVEEEVRVCDYCGEEMDGDNYWHLRRNKQKDIVDFDLCRKHNDEAIKLLEAWVKRGKPKQNEWYMSIPMNLMDYPMAPGIGGY